jgi:hypothetical protein
VYHFDMEREHAPLPDDVLEGAEPSEEDLAELTRLEHPGATPLTPELRKKQKEDAEAARRKIRRQFGIDSQGDMFPHL